MIAHRWFFLGTTSLLGVTDWLFSKKLDWGKFFFFFPFK